MQGKETPAAQIASALSELQAAAAAIPDGEQDAPAREAFAQLVHELERLNDNYQALGKLLGEDRN